MPNSNTEESINLQRLEILSEAIILRLRYKFITKTGTVVNVAIAAKKRLESMRQALRLENLDIEAFWNRHIEIDQYIKVKVD